MLPENHASEGNLLTSSAMQRRVLMILYYRASTNDFRATAAVDTSRQLTVISFTNLIPLMCAELRVKCGASPRR
jgi:hypothetical protein